MVPKFEVHEDKTFIRFNWSLFLSLTVAVLTAIVWLILLITNINKNVELMQAYYVKTIEQHTEWIKELQISERKQDVNLLYNTYRLDSHVGEIK